MGDEGGHAGGQERVRHPVFARLYLRSISERSAGPEESYRRELLAGLSGRVLEVGAGSGINFELYPASVSEVLAVEPEPVLRAAALSNAAAAPVPVTVVDGVASRLPVDDGGFDAVVASLVLCSVSDQAQALAECRRVLAPGGELRFYEHVVATGGRAAAVQRLADALFWPRIAGGCHMARDTSAAIAAAGFEIESCRRFQFSPGPPVPAVPHILGRARRGP